MHTHFLMDATTLLKAYSQVYIFMTLIPVIISFMTFTLLSVILAALALLDSKSILIIIIIINYYNHKKHLP